MKEIRCLYFVSFDTRSLSTREKVHFTDEFMGFICNIRVSQLAVEMHLFQGE